MGLSSADIVELNKLYVVEGLTDIDKIKESVSYDALAQKANITLIELNELVQYLKQQGKTLSDFFKEMS